MTATAPKRKVSSHVPLSRQGALLIALTILTVAVGLVMVGSASAVDSYKSTNNAAATLMDQATFAGLGLIGMLFASRLPVSVYRRFAMIYLYFWLGVQLVTVLFGVEINGNRNWLNIGFAQIQPSEFLKLALILALAHLLSQLGSSVEQDRGIWVLVFIYSGVSLLLVVLLGKDMGTGVVMAMFLMGMYLFAGMGFGRWLMMSSMGLVAAAALIWTSPSRRSRFEAWLFPDSADPMGVRWQYEHGTWALASGGIFGTGLGRSKLKWSWIPEVENDFIFAVIGEELGLVGAMFVVLLFFALGVTLFSIAKNQTNAFSRNIVIGVMVWISLQAFVNIGVVLGLFPVLGVPLPLVSAGGSSLISTMTAIGVVLAVERNRVAHLGRSR